VGEKQHCQKEIIEHSEGLLQKNIPLLQHRWTTELNIHLEHPVSTKTVWHELHKSNIPSRLAIAVPLITESNAQICKRWWHDHKTWTSDNWKRAYVMVTWVVPHAVPYISMSLSLMNTQGSRNAWFTGRFCDGLGSNIMVQYSVGPINTLYGRITEREYMDRLGNQVHPVIQTLFSNNDAVFQDDSAPIHAAWTVQSWFEEHENISHQHNHQVWTSLNNCGQFWRQEWWTGSHL
jgi:hypothetical protein